MSWQIDPVLIPLPDSFESERLVIRFPCAGEGEAINAAIQESLENLKPWMPWAHDGMTVEEIEINLRQAVARVQLREDLRMNLWRKSDGLFVGGSGLHRIDWKVPRFEIGYWVRASLEGQGYITEAVRRITDFAFVDLRAERVEIRCDAANERSAAVAQRAGFTLEARMRNQDRAVDGSLRDTLVFAMIRADRDTGR